MNKVIPQLKSLILWLSPLEKVTQGEYDLFFLFFFYDKLLLTEGSIGKREQEKSPHSYQESAIHSHLKWYNNIMGQGRFEIIKETKS